MIKKSLPFFGVLVLVIVILLSFFFIKKHEDYKDVDVFLSVPINATSILYVNDSEELLTKINTNNELWNEFKKIGFVDDFYLSSKNVFAPFVKQLSVLENNKTRSVCISSHLIGNRKLKLLVSLPMSSYSEEKAIIKKIQSFSNENYILNKRTYSDVDIFSFENKQRQINISFSKGILLMSSSSILIEESIRQLQSEHSLNDVAAFEEIKKTRGKNVDANLYVNIKRLARSFSLLSNKDFYYFFKKGIYLGSWMSLDVSIKNNDISLSGFHSNKLGELMNLCATQEPRAISIDKLVPSYTQLLLSITISDIESFKTNFENFIIRGKLVKQHKKILAKSENITGVNPQDLLFSLGLEEIALAITGNTIEDKFCVLKLKNREFAHGEMQKFINTYAQKENKLVNSYLHKYVLGDSNMFNIYSLPENVCLSSIFGDIFNLKGDNCFVFIDDYLVFANSIKELKVFINNVILENTLYNSKDYKLLEDYYSQKSNLLLYCNMSTFLNNFSKLFKKSIQKEIISNSKHIRKFKSIGLQLINENDFIYNNLFVKYDSVQNVEARKIWSLKLDTNLVRMPEILPSHILTKHVCIIQDLTNKIYFINYLGEIISSKQINSPIVGDIHPIDFYNNGKIQYIFSTKDEIHCLDIQSKNVASYPIYLNYTTTKGISVFSYDSKKDYRIFVPSNKKIYVYTKEAKKVKGWVFKDTKDTIIRKIQYFKLKGKDYIVVVDKNKIYMLNRRGQERLKIKTKIQLSESNIFYLKKQKDTKLEYLLTSSITGDIINIFFNGDLKIQKVGVNEKEHSFLPVDITKDGLLDYVYSYDNTLKIFSNKGELLLDKKLKLKISYPPLVYFHKKKFVGLGVCLSQLNKSYLFNIKGENIKGFPLEANTPLVIFPSDENESSFRIILGNNSNYLFSYNID